MNPRPKLDDVVTALEGARPTLDVQDEGVARSIYEALSEGNPVSVSRIAEATGVDVTAVEHKLAAWPGVFRDDAGDVIGFWGLTVAEFGEHRMRVDGRTTSPWCAWDPLFIIPILGRSGLVESVCPVTGTRISLELGPEGVRTVSPPDVVVSFLVPDGKFDSDVLQSFCHYVLFFADRRAGDRWIADHPGTFLLSLEEALELARRAAPLRPEGSSDDFGADGAPRGDSKDGT